MSENEKVELTTEEYRRVLIIVNELQELREGIRWLIELLTMEKQKYYANELRLLIRE